MGAQGYAIEHNILFQHKQSAMNMENNGKK